MYKTLKKKLMYKNKWIRLWEDEVEFPDGTKGIYAYTDRIDNGPMIIPVTNEGRLVVLREWRYPLQGWVYDFPCGGREEHETMLVSAKRELEEETGYRASQWTHLGDYCIDPGGTSQQTSVFLAEQLSRGNVKLDSGEIHGMHELTLGELEHLSTSGGILSGWLLAGLSLFRIHLDSKI